MSQKLPVNEFEWTNICQNLMMMKIVIKDIHSDLPFFPERMKIKKCNKLVCNLYDKNNYTAHRRTFKKALNHGFILENEHKVIQFNQKACLKSHIDMNTQDVYENIEEYNLGKKTKVLIVFDDMVADMISNKN